MTDNPFIREGRFDFSSWEHWHTIAFTPLTGWVNLCKGRQSIYRPERRCHGYEIHNCPGMLLQESTQDDVALEREVQARKARRPGLEAPLPARRAPTDRRRAFYAARHHSGGDLLVADQWLVQYVASMPRSLFVRWEEELNAEYDRLPLEARQLHELVEKKFAVWAP